MKIDRSLPSTPSGLCRWFAVVCLSASFLQACGGNSQSADSASLTPSAEALTKDWVDQGEAKALSLGTDSKP